MVDSLKIRKSKKVVYEKQCAFLIGIIYHYFSEKREFIDVWLNRQLIVDIPYYIDSDDLLQNKP